MFKYIFAVIIFCGICNSKHSDSLYKDIDITELTSENFDKNVINNEDDSAWIVVFYAPWCYYSQALVPEFKAAAKVLRHVVYFGAVNGERYEHLRIKFQVPGFPYIKIFGRDKDKPESFLGERKAKNLIVAGWTAELNNWDESQIF